MVNLNLYRKIIILNPIIAFDEYLHFYAVDNFGTGKDIFC